MIEFDVGQRVKNIRNQKNISIRELSRRSGVSATQISEIERNISAPTVPTLLKIINGLGAAASIFFDTTVQKSVSIVRKDERQEFIDRKNHVSLQSLSNGIKDTKLKIFISHPEPGVTNIRGGYKHAGEEFIHVIKGKVQVTLDETKHILHEGDSIHFKGEFLHTIKNITDHQIELLVVISPPNY